MFERLRRRSAARAIEFDPSSLAELANVSSTVVAIAVDGRIAFANPIAERQFGEATPGGLIGRPLLERIHAADRARFGALLASAADTGRAEITRVRIELPDGGGNDLDVALVPVSFGGRRAVIVNGHDTQEVQRTRAALQESERRYESLIAAAPVAIFRLDADGRCLQLNRRWSELTGIAIEEALGERWRDFVPPEAQSFVRDVGRQLAGSGEYRAERTVHRRDGSSVRVLVHVVGEHDGEGRATGYIGTITDLSDREAARSALARSEERLRLALQAAKMVTWEVPAGSTRIEWSEGAASVLGFPPDFLPIDADRALVAVEDSEVSFRSGSAFESLASREPFEFETRLEAPDGPRWLLVRGQAPGHRSGESARIVGVIADVSARRRDAEERALLERKLVEAQRLESLGLLAGGVAHDFNNLLVGILGNAELALERLPEGAPARDLLLGMRQSAVRASELARQILAFSGSQPLAARAVDLRELTHETLALVAAALPRGARVRLAPNARPAFVSGDPTQLRQVLMNLVINACESLPEGRGEVDVAIEPVARAASSEAPAGAWLALDVRDTGAGMDAQTRGRIFEPFYSTRGTGRGLGLAVAHGIVRAHGGAIEVESEPGSGTRMRILLPEIAEPERAHAAPEAPDAGAAAGPALVLVVDDERAVREVVRVALEAAGHRVLLAANAADARAALAPDAEEVDAVVLDLSLGSESSERLLAEIRARSSGLPVLVTSGYPEEEALGRLSALGVSAFLQKPFTLAKLNAAVARALAANPSAGDS